MTSDSATPDPADEDQQETQQETQQDEEERHLQEENAETSLDQPSS